MTTLDLDTLTPLLQSLDWQAYLPTFTLLLNRFEGTEEWLDDADCLPGYLLAWLIALNGRQPTIRTLLPLRHSPLLRLRVFHASDHTDWDYRQTSFQDFMAQPTTVYFAPQLPRPIKPLTQCRGFLKQHATG